MIRRHLGRARDAYLRAIALYAVAIALSSRLLTPETPVGMIASIVVLLALNWILSLRAAVDRRAYATTTKIRAVARWLKVSPRELASDVRAFFSAVAALIVLAVLGIRVVEVATHGAALDLLALEVYRAIAVILVAIVLERRLWKVERLRSAARVSLIALVVTGLTIGPAAPTLESGGISPVGTAQAATASFSCDQGSLSTTCVVGTSQNVTGLTISGSGTLEVNSSGNLFTNDGSYDVNYSDIADINMGGDVVVNGTINGNFNITATDLNVKENGRIISTGKGYDQGNGPGGGDADDGGTNGEGGSYGGEGADTASRTRPSTYGSATDPTRFGSGGGRGDGGESSSGGRGGGAINIDLSGTATVNGKITSNGTGGTHGVQNDNGGGGDGSGGSVLIKANTIRGSGQIAANAGAGTDRGVKNSGGGGRVAVHFSSWSYTGTVRAAGGPRRYGNADSIGGEGTVYLEDTDTGESARSDIGMLTGLSSVAFEPYGGGGNHQGDRIAIYTPRTIYNDFNDFSGGWETGVGADNWADLTVNASDVTFTTGMVGRGKVNLTINKADTINVSASLSSFQYSKFSVESRFILQSGRKIHGNATGHPERTGPGAGADGEYCNGDGAGGGGGGYGGAGGKGAQSCGGSGGSTYGNNESPTALGSGGGNGYEGNNGGDGGGVVIINGSGADGVRSATITVDGIIAVTGQQSQGDLEGGGGGSGGSIWIIADQIDGAGKLVSEGGHGTNDGGGGGGGRIAVEYNGGNVPSGDVSGGTSGNGKAGESGSFVVNQLAAKVSGEVVDQNGEPVSGATVELWMMVDAETSTDPGETVEEAQEDVVDELTRAVPRDRFDLDADLLNGEKYTGEGAGRMVLVHEEGAWFEGNVEVLGQELPIGTPARGLEVPLIQLEPGTQYAFSIWDRSEEPLLEDAIDRKIDPGVSKRGTVVLEQIGPGNSTINRLELGTEPEVQAFTGKKHEYARAALPTGYYVLRPKQGGTPVVVRVGQPERIPRHFNKDLKNADGEVSSIATTTRDKIAAGSLKRVTVETNSTGQFSHNVPRGYSTVAITVFDGQGLTEGITDPTLTDLRTQVAQQDYNGSIYLSSSPEIVHPPKSGIEITVVEISRPTLSDLQAYLAHFSWLEELLNDEAFARLSTLWTDPTGDVPTEDLLDRVRELNDLVEQNDELNQRLAEIQPDLERLRSELEAGTISRSDALELLGSLTQVVQEAGGGTIDVGDGEGPTYGVPDAPDEPTLLNIRLPVDSRAGEDSSLTEAGVTVLVHFDNGTSTTMDRSYYSIDNNPGASQGTGSEIVIEDYPIPADVAVASLEVLVANSEGTGRTEVPVENPAFEGTPPQLASINVGTMRPGPNQSVSITVTPTDSSTFKSLEDASAYGPNGGELSTTISDGKVSFTTAGEGSHLVKLVVSDGAHNYTESFRIKAGAEDVDYPASVRVINGVLGRTVIASDGVSEAEVETSRGGSIAQITAKVDPSDVPREIHVHAREVTGIQQEVAVSIVSSKDESRIQRPVRVKLHLSRLSEDALVRANERAIPDDGNRWGRVEHKTDSTLVTTIAEGTDATVEVDNNPSILAEISFWIDLQIQRLPSLPDA